MTLREKVANNFPSKIALPESWAKVLDWREANPHRDILISGTFDIYDDSKGLIPYWVNEDCREDLAIIGINESDGQYIFCIWCKTEDIMPVVTINDSSEVKVLTANIDDFIQLLAIGYVEVEIDDYDKPPYVRYKEYEMLLKNMEFKAFYKNTFKQEIPTTGREIVDRKNVSDEEFLQWLGSADEKHLRFSVKK